jgi:thiol:disulfide interchange protein DsbD
MALLYVLGMALMYSALGLIAALTGGLFGSFLQNPIVLIAIGALMVTLALSMFGLYELQPPPWLLEKLGGSGTTSAAGVFFSGLVVGVFAAPCVGPPVVALLAVVGAKGDPWFGFSSFFTLSMGLGAPYLVLATFSNLLQTLPRSGEWMVWVKKLFGVILLGVGVFYAMLAIAPAFAAWVIPVTLIVGGVYLGFFEKSANKRAGFRWAKRALGVAALVLSVSFVSRQLAHGVTLKPVTPEALAQAVASGRPVMIDFSADWCVPCHELEDVTFTNRAVIAAARDFHTFGVDLTRFDSPEAESQGPTPGPRPPLGSPWTPKPKPHS